MKHRHQRVIGAGTRARNAMLKYDVFAKPPFARHARTLDGCLERIEPLPVMIMVLANRSEKDQLRALRKELRLKYLIPISRIARRLGRHLGGLQDAYRAPHARANLDDLLAGAERMLKAARPHSAFLIEMGVHKDFVTQIRARVAQLKKISAEADRRLRERTEARASMKRELVTIRSTLDVIDALCDAHIPGSDAALSFRIANRVGKKIGRKSSRGRRKPPPPDAGTS